jgi:hypothetical protein
MILKKNKISHFTQIDNEPIQSGVLSYKAIGILTYLLSKTDDWEVSVEELGSRSPKDGVSAVRTGLAELVDNGFAALVPVRDVHTGAMGGRRYVVSDDKEWIRTIQEAGELSAIAEGERYRLDLSHRHAENPDVGKIPTSGKSDPTKERQLKNKDSKYHSDKPDGSSKAHHFSIDDWQYKASKWWLDFVKSAELLPPSITKKNTDEKLIQEWAGVLDKLNRIDGYDPKIIGQVLNWLKKTKDDSNQGGFWIESAKLSSLGSLRKKSASDKMFSKFDMILSSYNRHNKNDNGGNTQQARRPVRG